MKEILLKIITLIHILFVLFVVVAPFTSSNYILFVHAIFIPFLLVHWVCNDNTCVLTIIERKLRKQLYKDYDDDDCITCRLVEPVYDFRKNYKSFTVLIYTVTILLWSISVSKLAYRYKGGEIKSYKDLFEV
jgi:hypothetical protein